MQILIATTSGLQIRRSSKHDHVESILFTDRLNGLKKRLIKNRLTKITKGDVDADYRMKFPALARKR